MRTPHTNLRSRGFTLVEALLAAVVLAMAVTAITMPFSSGAMNDQVDARHTLAVNLAQEMMEEILSKPFSDPQGASAPGPEPGESRRAYFDNVDDYHGYTEGEGSIANRSGEVVTDPAAKGLSRRVTVQYVYVAGQETSQDPSFVRVVVEVRYNGDPVATLVRLVYNTA